MSEDKDDVLPYRTDVPSLLRWVERRARGRSAAQLRETASSAKALEGTAVAADALGFWDRERDRLTPLGERLALAAEGERIPLLRSAVLGYPPYRGLLEAVTERPDRQVTDAQWIETWWATHGYGSSQSNRMEGAAVLGRLVEQLGLGRYIPGRRGHPTRIEWSQDALRGEAADSATESPDRLEARSAPPPSAPPAGPPAPTRPSGPPPQVPSQPREAGRVNPVEYNEVAVPLDGGAVARLVVPQRLPAEEKRRLLTLLDLLIRAEE